MFDVFRRDLTVTRKAIGSYVNGLWVDNGQNSSFTIKASVQATDAEILQTGPVLRTSSFAATWSS